ncbi:MAG: hypothetical protein IPJ33_01895 [Gammaproteobacteria bacterium]|nr:hypothetical protein [Gammaproteobacteria bacterium]MBP6053797.1 hypothetical protein [Pseudomonadales bacterium]MBK6583907.1 hypothetical protein [Gammaproteobacteria bacterium]MBK7169807.1 hypothetical protein [Gammaproteobacteria bacterium]MBK7522243.1 hypothetical protein [Gammaproteobacteria bacterium]
MDTGITPSREEQRAQAPAPRWQSISEKLRRGMIASDMVDPEAEGERIDIGRFGHYHPDTSLIQVVAEGGLLIALNVRGATKAQILDLANRALARLDRVDPDCPQGWMESYSM